MKDEDEETNISLDALYTYWAGFSFSPCIAHQYFIHFDFFSIIFDTMLIWWDVLLRNAFFFSFLKNKFELNHPICALRRFHLTLPFFHILPNDLFSFPCARSSCKSIYYHTTFFFDCREVIRASFVIANFFEVVTVLTVYAQRMRCCAVCYVRNTIRHRCHICVRRPSICGSSISFFRQLCQTTSVFFVS